MSYHIEDLTKVVPEGWRVSIDFRINNDDDYDSYFLEIVSPDTEFRRSYQIADDIWKISTEAYNYFVECVDEFEHID